MKNKRQIAKLQTFDKIIATTKQLISDIGIIDLKTLEVAKKAGIAHGTLFSHFETKEALIAKVCQNELLAIAKTLKKITEQDTGVISLLKSYLNLVAENEDFYVVIAREFPFLDTSIQERILANETIIKNMLYQKIEAGNNAGQFNVEDITMTISFFFASINYYLSRKEYFVSGRGKLMNQKKKQLIKTFMNLLN
jgi:AcrR family transcriptional regulator